MKRLKGLKMMTMNKKIILSAAALLLLMASCSSDDNNVTEDGKVNVAKAIEFKVAFADYNSEQEVGVTRASDNETNIERQTVDLGNGVLAQCTLQRDTAMQTSQDATRALSPLADDTYTMLAYDAATHVYKGGVTGQVASGTFTPNPSQRLSLAPGTYDFVLYNSKVTRSGNTLTVSRANALTAFMGRTTQTITAAPHTTEYVPFTMKRIGARVKIKLSGYMPYSGVTATLASINATDVPGSSTYDIPTNTWTTGPGAAMSANTTYGTSAQEGFASSPYVIRSNEKIAFLPTTDVSKLKLTFTNGHIYRSNMANVDLTFHPASTLKLQQNGAYVLNVELMYRYLYLMSDGTTGFFNETTYGGGSKTPIAIVFSRSKRMAIALHNAPGDYQTTQFCVGKYEMVKTCTHADDQTTSGLDETWNASYTTAAVTGDKVKGNNPDFPAFYHAAHYNPGVAYTGTPALRWYLPTVGDYRKCLSSLCFTEGSVIYLVSLDRGITQVGGVEQTGQYYHTSSEVMGFTTYSADGRYYKGYELDPTNMFNYYNKTDDSPVRPFVAY